MSKLDEDNDALLGARGKQESGGATQSVGRDDRVTRLLDYAQPVVTTIAAAAIIYLANQFGDLKDAIIDLKTQTALSRQTASATADILKDHEIRMRAAEGDIRTLQGKVFRGVDGYEETKHGR